MNQVYFEKPKPDEVLNLLLEGNRCFVEGNLTHPNSDPKRRNLSATVSQGDYAIATILSCSDSRVPPELIFDCGIMDLFVVRLAGNVLCKSALASIEYGVLHVHTPLLLVMTHSQCGAVTAVVNELQKSEPVKNSEHEHTHIHKLFEYITPIVQPLLQEEKSPSNIQSFINLCAREHAKHIVQEIRQKSKPIAEKEFFGKVKIVPVYYELETGKVFCIE
ncbi:MAG: carbonic anhydrase [Candidatus Hydrogenedens sp.]